MGNGQCTHERLCLPYDCIALHLHLQPRATDMLHRDTTTLGKHDAGKG
jgi:hypothetical protein